MSGAASKIADGLVRLSRVLRKDAWAEAGARGITPTQGQILALVASAAEPPRLGDVARALGIKPATASKAVATLLEKELVAKHRAADDARALALSLTAAGRREAKRVSRWPDAVAAVVGTLDAEEQAVLLRTLVKIIRRLQLRGDLEARTCAGCAHFRPFVHEGAAPHHCAFVDAPLGDADLRVDCADQAPPPRDVASDIARRFLRVVG
ncbi:MAG: MarR family winged helix-turn-helix transcriptional regulator [Sandaracinaceae bacterium]|nr:MarR family transcriptional regulator [Myxococcales bacterium]